MANEPHNTRNNEHQGEEKEKIVVGQARHVKRYHEHHPEIDQGQAYPCGVRLQEVSHMEQVFLHDGCKSNKKRRSQAYFLC